ncbi:MAG: aminoglycoside phosphotransferase family protein [Clostridia bacterium]|nr:aminoglycoside phosphotransferase family protein [Clostridia bacterium]
MMNELQKVIESFAFDGEVVKTEPFGSGHINETLLLTSKKNTQYILQKMNTYVFTDPQGLMENVFGVTEFLKKRIVEQGGNPNRETLTFIQTKDGDLYYNGPEGAWRAYRFQSDLMALNAARSPRDFYASGKAFGRFQALLGSYPAETLHETIPHFHDTPARMKQLHEAIEKNASGRLETVKEEVEFALAREDSSAIVMDLQEQGVLPLRVTHNDTKLNNVLLDPETGEGICVIDLDTVMPGQAIFDFGDSIRYGASTAAEDEKDLSKVQLDLELFDAYTQGFLEGCHNVLSPAEKDLLPTGAWMMTLECGIRFLADYLNGDVYFKCDYPEHNLVRARTQFKLVQEMEEKQDQMQAIVAKY